MTPFRRRKSATSSEAAQLRAAILADRGTSEEERIRNASAAIELFAERLLADHQRRLAETAEALTAAWTAAPSLPPPPPPTRELTRPTLTGLPDPATSLTYITGLAESAVRSTASLAAALDSLRSAHDQLRAHVSTAGHDLSTRIADLRTSQIRAANEQARFEIAMREEIAQVVERLQHGKALT